ncbi:MAG TPA: hypothetical protein VNS55_14210 [Nocardioides sp.]|nr:hypothetical protein [Nocardioides sp.]
MAASAPLLAGCSGDEPYVAPTAAPHSDAPRPATAADTLRSLERAVRTRDEGRAAELGTGDGAGNLLTTLTRNATALRLRGVGFHYLTETGQVAADGGWTASVEVTWQYGGFDRRPGRTTVAVSFDPDGTGITAIGAGDGAVPLWLTGPVAVRRTDNSLVVAAGRQERHLADYARQARVAIASVTDVLGPGPRLVVEVPSSVQQLDRAVGADPGTYDRIAAVTASSDGSQAPGSAVHVFLNPAVYDDLDPVAAQVVMTHEATHAATGAPLVQGVDLWLLEGFADYVALHDTTLPFSKTAAQAIALVRRDGVPAALPSDPEFDTQASQLGTVYEEAWLVCVTLADHAGQQALVDFYDAVTAGRDLERSLRTSFGWSLADLTAAWQEKLATLAGVPESPRG